MHLLDFEIGLLASVGIQEVMPQTRQVDAYRTQRFELTLCPPDLIASHGGHEMRQFMPEPLDLAAQLLQLLRQKQG